MTIARVLTDAATALTQVSDSPRLDAEILLAHELRVPRSYLIAHPEAALEAGSEARFRNDLARRADGEPVAYILGEKEFWSLSLRVDPATLVPRPETELLVEHALDRIPPDERMSVLDLGTGSGAVALAIGSERPLSQVTGTDISAAALVVARDNATRLGIDNVRFVVGDWTDPVRNERFDIIVSNPPYVAESDPALAMLAHEPRTALVSGSDGLDDIRGIAVQSTHIVQSKGAILLEHGADQGDAVADILAAAGWRHVRSVVDLAGLPRITVAVHAVS